MWPPQQVTCEIYIFISHFINLEKVYISSTNVFYPIYKNYSIQYVIGMQTMNDLV